MSALLRGLTLPISSRTMSVAPGWFAKSAKMISYNGGSRKQDFGKVQLQFCGWFGMWGRSVSYRRLEDGFPR